MYDKTKDTLLTIVLFLQWPLVDTLVVSSSSASSSASRGKIDDPQGTITCSSLYLKTVLPVWGLCHQVYKRNCIYLVQNATMKLWKQELWWGLQGINFLKDDQGSLSLYLFMYVSMGSEPKYCFDFQSWLMQLKLELHQLWPYFILGRFASSYLKSAIPNQWTLSILGHLFMKYGFNVANLYFIARTNVYDCFEVHSTYSFMSF